MPWQGIPYFVAEVDKLLLIGRIKSRSRPWINQHSGIESPSSKHDCSLDVWVLVEDVLCDIINTRWLLLDIEVIVPSGPGFV